MCPLLRCSSGEEVEVDWGAPMAWGWPFLLRLAAAHRRRQPRLAPPGSASAGAVETSPLASLPTTGVCSSLCIVQTFGRRYTRLRQGMLSSASLCTIGVCY